MKETSKMKVCVIQPEYSLDDKDLDECFEDFLVLIDKCDESLDIIVLPEYSDVLAAVRGEDKFYRACEKYNSVILEKAQRTAKRCHSIVFVNAGYMTENGIRNTTYAIDRNGDIAGKYFPESEKQTWA